ncbi:MAG: hypothetical protein DI629_20580 [Mesorhizobium amorphae]|nr:MAG: hypothetical protein DI629_20580 [Mesorhizobium amorphae]
MRLACLGLVGLVALSGCSTVGPAERRLADEETCREYGFRQGSDAFAECLQRIELDRRADVRAWRYNNGFVRGGVIYGRIGI